jgi:selenocysteine-specific elongation factor
VANVIVGTAGHIDHGKTTLIKALTGIETDRLIEEKKRGITIDLGFAYFDLPSGKRAGIIDVPGHERFIRNMLSGATGIDLVLMVVSAEEGVKPQTVEHLHILDLLGLKNGIVVFTKSDLVDKDYLDLVMEETREKFSGTFLEQAEFIPVSALSGENLPYLINRIDELCKNISVNNENVPFRLPIDRVFTLKGFGTVVTGTLIEGKIDKNITCYIYPKGYEVKVRSIQVHSKDVENAFAGQRVAINLPNIDVLSIDRGDILAPKGSMINTKILDVKIRLIKDSIRTIKNWTLLRIYHGTREVFGRIVLLDKEEINPGETVYAQLRLETETAVKYSDRFILRFYSPMETIGGGIILDPNAQKHKRYSEDIINELYFKEVASDSFKVENTIKKHSLPMKETEITKELGISLEQASELVNSLKAENKIFVFKDETILHMDVLESYSENVLNVLDQFHKSNHLKFGMTKEEIRSRIFKDFKSKSFEEVLELLILNNSIKYNQIYFSTFEFKIELDKKSSEIYDRILIEFKNNGYKPPSIKNVIEESNKLHKDIFNLLVSEGKIVKINSEIYYENSFYKDIREKIINHIEINGKISVSELKDLVDISRKYSVPFMEHLDDVKVTRRDGDFRILI